MAIPDEDVAQVRSATDILAVIGEYTPLKRVGRRYQGLCPFHAEKSASFSVNAEEGLYYCFGCTASGDAITFLRNIEGCDFVEAVEKLAARAGITIRHDAGGKDGSDREGRQALLGVMERAVAFYHEELLSHPDANRARQYLRSRDYKGDTVRQFSLGWAPEAGGSLVRAVRAPADLLVKAGLAHRGQSGLRDAFRGRVIFPIFDPMGKALGLGGRILPGAGEGAGPKYRNSPETPIYSKRRTLYGLNWAKQAVVQASEVIICEGYTDVIGFFQAGVPRAVATCGTALAEEHFTLLRNFGRRIVLAYDADGAGQSATSRVYEWERRHEVDVVVADLPKGSDPGDLSRSDPAALARAVVEARPFLQFRVDRILSAGDLTTAEGRARAAESALSAVAEHPDVLVRDQYVMQLSDRCRLDAPRLRERLEHLRAHPPAEPNARQARHEPVRHQPRSDPGDVREPDDYDDVSDWEEPVDVVQPQKAGPGLEALKLAVHRPEEVADRLQPVLFTDPLQREAFTALVQHDDLHDAIASASPEVAGLLRRVTVEEPLIGDPAFGDPVDLVVGVLLREDVRRELSEVEKASRGLGESWQAGAALTAQVRHWLDELEDPGSVRGAVDRLVAWLMEREPKEG